MVRFALCSVLLAGCQTSSFVCQTDVQCGAMGRCEANGACSFPDDTCESGRRYGEFAMNAGACVPVEETGTESTTVMPSTSAGHTSFDETGEASTNPVSLSDTTATTSTTMSEGASTSSTTEAAESSSTGGPPVDPYDFEDDFERPDSPDVGNDWVEKLPDAFSLVDGGLRRTSGATPYPNNLVYRPDEQWLDAEAVLSLTFDMVEPWGFPQFILRTQLDDVDVPDSVTGYLLFIETEGVLMITRQIAGEFTLEEIVPLAGPIEIGEPYRMRMRVTGTDPAVQIDGYLEALVGGEWVVHTEAHMTDASAMRISAPGTLALGAHDTLGAWTYEHVGLYDLGG